MVAVTVNDRFDLAIIGGGIVGAWCLYLAATRYPSMRVVLIERSIIGGGATAHSGGISLAIGQTAWERKLAASSAKHYERISGILGIRPDTASAYWIIDSKGVARLREIALAAAELSLCDLCDLTDHVHASARLGQSDVVLSGGTPLSYEAADVTRALVRCCRQLPNVSCWEATEVASLSPSGSGVLIQLTGGRNLGAGKAIVAVGPWILGDLSGAVARAADIRIKKVVALHIDEVPPPGASALFLPASDAYLMPLPTRKQWLFSFRSDEWGCAPQSHELTITDTDRVTANALLHRYLPGMLGKDRGGRVFCDSYTPSGTPIVARSPDIDTLVVVGAGSGAGFRFAPGVAETAIQMIL